LVSSKEKEAAGLRISNDEIYIQSAHLYAFVGFKILRNTDGGIMWRILQVHHIRSDVVLDPSCDFFPAVNQVTLFKNQDAAHTRSYVDIYSIFRF
jgi:hypothetical protein